MTEQCILLQKENGVGIVTLNRPSKYNSFNPGMYRRLLEICDEIKEDNGIRVVIVTGAGKNFSAGADLSTGSDGVAEHQNDEFDRQLEALRLMKSTESQKSFWGFISIPKPTICAINGIAIGIGAEIPLQCDIRVASENARYGQVFALRGLTPDTGAGTWLLPRIIGISKACELIFSGRIIDAQEMLAIGLVSKVVKVDDLMSATIELANSFKKCAPLALKMCKRQIYMGLERSMETQQMIGISDVELAFRTQDFKEGVNSFLEKRDPIWQGK